MRAPIYCTDPFGKLLNFGQKPPTPGMLDFIANGMELFNASFGIGVGVFDDAEDDEHIFKIVKLPHGAPKRANWFITIL